LREVAERVYADLQRAGVEVVLDDRDERAGVKFKDMDLVGVPIQIVVGRSVRERGEVEIRLRRNRNDRHYVPVNAVTERVLTLRRQLYAELTPNEEA
jgi:prolyl-tRNA synthetase